MKTDFDISGKVALVTGGNVGIGREIARRFLAHGCSVYTCSRRDYDAPPAAEGLEGVEGRIFHMSCDVREPEALDEVVRRTMDAFGRIDLLVNNAGGSPGTSAATASPNFTSKIVTLNLTSPMVLSQKVNAIMQEQDSGGIIVNIASVAGLMPSPMLAAYGAAKAGLINMTRSLAVEYAPKVRVNCIAPGFILTEGADYLLPTAEAKQAAAEQSPLRYLAGPDVIADACVFLASPASRYVNGETIVIDGGGRIRPAT